MEQTNRILYVCSTLFLLLAVLSVVTLVASFASGEMNVTTLAETAGVSEDLVKPVYIATIIFAVLSILALLYMGLMGLRQAQGKPTGSAHITIAIVCTVFLAIALIFELINFFNAPKKDWVGLCTCLASVFFAVYYIRSAKALKS